MRFKKSIAFFVVVILSAGALYAFRESISLMIAKRFTAQRMSSNPLKDLPDGLHVAVCGAGSPMPDDKRGGPCTLIIAGQQLFVFDTGNTSARNINKMGFNAGNIDGIFLTHFHSDHIDGLGELLLQKIACIRPSAFDQPQMAQFQKAIKALRIKVRPCCLDIFGGCGHVSFKKIV